jgi:hypothetical protein
MEPEDCSAIWMVAMSDRWMIFEDREMGISLRLSAVS